LAAFIERVGRAQRRDDLPPRQNDTPRAAPPRPLAVKAIEIRLADQPGAVRGIKRSGLISRMLASEAALMPTRCCIGCGARAWPSHSC
jgi:hypothetical protein